MIGYEVLEPDLSGLPSEAIVYDIVYAPLETALLTEANGRGLRTLDGLNMLIGQAAKAFQLFFGAEAPREHDFELRALLAARSEEHTSELQSLMRISYAVFCLKKKKHNINRNMKYTASKTPT